MGPKFGWQVPFAVVGSATLLFGILMRRFVSEAKFSHPSSAVDSSKSWTGIKRVLQTPSAVLVFLQGFFGCVPWAVINTFLPDIDIGPISFLDGGKAKHSILSEQHFRKEYSVTSNALFQARYCVPKYKAEKLTIQVCLVQIYIFDNMS